MTFFETWMGRGLEKEVGYLIYGGIHSKEINPVEKRIIIPEQLDFFDQSLADRRKQNPQLELDYASLKGALSRYWADKLTLSDFYERVSAALYGGERFNRKYVLTGDTVSLRDGEPSLNGWSSHESLIKLIQPDLIDPNTHLIGEVKAFRSGSCYKLKDSQMTRYGYLQFSMPLDTVINFIMYRHIVRDFCPSDKNPSEKYTDRELLDALTEKTALSVVVPYNVMSLLHKGRCKWIRRDSGKNKMGFLTREPGTSLRSPGANMILTNPEDFLRDLNLDPDDYEIVKARSPDNFYFGDRQIKPFPITIIKYRKYEEWAKEFKNNPPKEISEFLRNEGPLLDIQETDSEDSGSQLLYGDFEPELSEATDNAPF